MRFLLIGMLGCMLALSGVATAQVPKNFNLFEVLPERTIAVVGIPDIGQVTKAAKQLSFYQLLSNPQIRQFFSPAWKMVEPKSRLEFWPGQKPPKIPP